MSAYATKVNNFYNQKESHFVSLRERLVESLGDSFEPLLDRMIEEFKRRHKEWKKFADMQLCQAIQVPMDKILIDTTMQRQVNLNHILNIISYFKETMVMAIQVYKDPEKPGYYIAWDGQHTAIVLYALATKAFGERIAELMVPVVVYNVKQKAEIRRNFILLNGDAKEPLDFIDLWRQMVSGVRVDGADDPLWISTELKQSYLESAGIFVTHEKFGDENEVGAFTLLADTIMSKSETNIKDPEVTRMFAEYWVLINQQRPVAGKEARQLFEFFDACYKAGIEVDSEYLKVFAQFTLDYFDADFSPSGPFWSKCKMVYSAWYRAANANNPDAERDDEGEIKVKGFNKEWKCGGPFLLAQLRKSTKLKVPAVDSDGEFVPSKKELW
jgi:hypothetical protein